MRLRVCNIGRHIYPSSLNDHAQDLEAFRALGRYLDEIHLIVQSADNTTRTERIENIHVYQIPRIVWSRALNHIVFVGRAFLHAFRLSRGGRIDVCDASEPLGGGVVACLMRRVTGVPCLVELQGDTLEFETGVDSRLKQILVRSVARLIVRRVDHIRAISDRVAYHARQAGVDAGRITVATSRLNFQRFRGRDSTGMRDVIRQQYGLPDGKIVGYIGRLHPLKGLRVLIDAWPYVAAKVPEATLVIVGDGPDRERLEKQAAALAESCRIVFAGRCHYDDVPSWLDALDIFVLPSFTEGTPRALIEAMAMELPVVATSVGDIPHGVLDAASGIIVPPRDAVGLANAIAKLLMDPGRAEVMGRRARRSVLRKFEFARSIRNLAMAHYRAAGRPFPVAD